MPWYQYIWTDEAVDHLAEHDITPEDFERVLENPVQNGKSRSTGRDAAWGYIADGRFVIAIYEPIDETTIVPVTCYEVPEF